MKNNQKTLKLAEIGGSFLLLAIFILPAIGLAGGSKIWVDDSASGKQDGSSKHPYKSIGVALSHADDGDEVHVLSGKYKENLIVPEDVEIYGSSAGSVTIEAKDDDEAVIEMNGHTKISKVTVKGGEHGIIIGKNDKARVMDCIIENNDRDGIHIKAARIEKSKEVSVTNSIIRDNGWAGIYSQSRKLVLIGNEIIDNKKDGALLESRVSAWIDENKFKDNKGSGMRINLDGSQIWTDDNSFSENGREGVEINAYGGYGRIDIKDANIHDNDRWGVARVQRGYFSSAVWNGVTFSEENKFYGNNYGDISPVIIVR